MDYRISAVPLEKRVQPAPFRPLGIVPSLPKSFALPLRQFDARNVMVPYAEGRGTVYEREYEQSFHVNRPVPEGVEMRAKPSQPARPSPRGSRRRRQQSASASEGRFTGNTVRRNPWPAALRRGAASMHILKYAYYYHGLMCMPHDDSWRAQTPL